MKKAIILFISLFTFSVYAQEVDYSQFFKNAQRLNVENLDTFVTQVFGNHAAEVKNTDRYVEYADLLSNKMAVAQLTTDQTGKIMSTSDLVLINDYNSNLTYDQDFNLTSFNPFKYDMNFSSNKAVAYRIGNSNFVLIILP
jgi:hypothetical protein